MLILAFKKAIEIKMRHFVYFTLSNKLQTKASMLSFQNLELLHIVYPQNPFSGTKLIVILSYRPEQAENFNKVLLLLKRHNSIQNGTCCFKIPFISLKNRLRRNPLYSQIRTAKILPRELGDIQYMVMV